MKKNPKIGDLSSISARNLLRGMLANTDVSDSVRQLEKIRKSCTESDYQIAIEIVRESPIFSGSSVGRDFNKKFTQLVGKQVVSAFSPEVILEKLRKNKKKLLDLLDICSKVLEAIARRDFSEGLRQCGILADSGGASLFLLRNLHFIKNHVSDADLLGEIEDVFRVLSVNNVRYVSNAIKELSSDKTDYINICERVNRSEPGVSVLVAQSFIDHIPRSANVFAQTLNSHYLISLLDAFLYFCRLQTASLPFVPLIDDDIVCAYQTLSEIKIKIEDIYDASDEIKGALVFREAFLLVELNQLYHYKTVHAALYNNLENKEERRTPYERLLLRDYFANVCRLSDIGSVPYSGGFGIDRYSAASACHFQNSTALIYALERSDGQLAGDDLDFVRLMSRTRDIGIICPAQHIESIKARAATDELKIVIHCLSHIKQKSQLKEHELRAVLQGSAERSFDGKLTALLSYIYSVSPSVAEHLIQTADETFLSKLFQIIKTPNAAIQERANILEWYAEKTGDVIFLERAKNLRIDVQINKERGTIDDSRIYVDPVKFTQWVNDHVLDDFAILLESLPQPIEAVLQSLTWEKVKTGIGIYEQLGSLVVKCYEEFCSNKIYGVASYLGRRIRHGTLKGTGFSDVANFVKNERFSALFELKEIEDAYRVWLKGYELALDELRDKYLHIHHKNKPEGLIFRDFRSATKRLAANHLLYDIIKSFGTNKSCLELPYIILEYCWRILEEDLSNIRKFVMERKAKHAVFRTAVSLTPIARQRELHEFGQELNSLTAERFRTIASWFNKPSIASPSADISLLFKAVVSEVKSLEPAYDPEVIVNDSGFILNGGTYFVLYDALFILIYNAAQKGRPDGVLIMNIGLEEIEGNKRVSIRLTSEIRSCDCIEVVRASILTALEGDCEDALVVEGRSGIKKLRRMEQEGNIEDVTFNFDVRKVSASFSFKVDY